MNDFFQTNLERRQQLCDEAQARLGLRAASIEKDFWVCWTLHELFSLPGCGSHLTFKGGTSLSKGWKLIERFSEDIDVVMEREFLGFGGDKGPEKAASNKERDRRLEQLKLACQRRIRESLKPELEQHFQAALPKGMKWELIDDADDTDRQTLLFHYPSAYAGAAYIRPVVKIELGGAHLDTVLTKRGRIPVTPADIIRAQPQNTLLLRPNSISGDLNLPFIYNSIIYRSRTVSRCTRWGRVPIRSLAARRKFSPT